MNYYYFFIIFFLILKIKLLKHYFGLLISLSYLVFFRSVLKNYNPYFHNLKKNKFTILFLF